MTPEQLDEEIGRMEMRYCDNNDYGFRELIEDWKKIHDQQEAEITRLKQSIADIRDAVLHERYQLAEAGLDNYQVNAVLGIIDDFTEQPT